MKNDPNNERAIEDEEWRILLEIDTHRKKLDVILEKIEEYIHRGFDVRSEAIQDLQKKLQIVENKTSFWSSKLSQFL